MLRVSTITPYFGKAKTLSSDFRQRAGIFPVFLRKRAVIPLVLLPIVALQACSKGTEQPPAKAAAESALLAKIPTSSFGFAAYDQASNAAEKLRGSPWSHEGTLEQSLGQVEGEEVKKLVKVVQALVKAGLISSSPTQPPAVKESVWFVGGDFTQSPEIGVFNSAASGVNLQDKLAALEGILKSDGFAPQKEQIGSSNAFSIPVELPNSKLKIPKVYFAATTELLAVSTSPTSAARLFDKEVKDGGTALRQSPLFKKASDRVASPKDQFAYAFLDLRAFLAQLQQIATFEQSKPADQKVDEKQEKQAGEDQEAGAPQGESSTPAPLSPEEQRAKFKEIVDQMPFDSFFGSGMMDDTLSYQLILGATPRNDDQKGWFAALESAGSAHVFNKVPQGMVFLLSLDGKLVRSIRDAAITEAPEEQKEQLKLSLAPLDSLTTIGIGVRNNSAGMPFPDVILVTESEKSVEIENSLRQMLTLATTSTGMTMSPWQTKEVEGVKINYTLTPLGIGIFLAESKGAVILASTEVAVRDVAAALADSKKSLSSAFSSSAQKTLGRANTPFVYFVNMTQTAAMLESLQGSLAMFTGGKTGIDTTQIEKLRKMGQTLGTVGFRDGMLEVFQTYEAPPKS